LSLLHLAAQTKEGLPRSAPETQGVSSRGISDFLDAAGKSKNEFHSFMFLRHGKVIAEGWWNPYRSDLKHSLYSVSKSFTSTAIGFAVSEGRMSVNDKIISFFPGDLPDSIPPYLSALTVKDMLSMLEGQNPDPTFSVTSRDSNWVKAFLALPIVHKPGTEFLYNTLGVYVLSAIVQKVTGEKVIDYLTPRLFQPLGIRGMDWEVSPQGINTGGWGLRLKTEDMAKVGQLYLQKGKWNGRQLLPQAWIEAAVTSRNDQGPEWASHTPRDSSDWRQGYGYLFWRCRHNAFRADGAMGQYIIVMPDEDAVIAITCETPDMQDEINLVWRYLLAAMHKDPLPADEAAETALKRQCAALALPLPPKSANLPASARISGKSFSIAPNNEHVAALSFRFTSNLCHVAWKTDTAVYELTFGPGAWQLGETTKRGPYLVADAKASLTGLPPFRIAGSYRWKDGNTLELVLRYIESPHTQTIICHFDQGKISVRIRSSLDGGRAETVLNGA
jgi:hypothetical protein